MKFYAAISFALQARENCAAKCDHAVTQGAKAPHAEEWYVRHGEKIERIVKQHAPSGSGFDSGTSFDFDASKPNRLVFNAPFHHMSEHGYYSGWSEHSIVVTPSFSGAIIRVTGRDRNQIKDYIGDVFGYLDSLEVSP